MSKREWLFYISDMINFAENVISYCDGLKQVDFDQKGITYDATVRNLELIGETASHIPDNVRNTNPAIPWRMIIATRNRLIHRYLGIDNDTLWSIIRDEIPELLEQLTELKEKSLLEK